MDTTASAASPASPPAGAGLGARILNWTTTRIVLAILATALPVAAVLLFANLAVEKSMRVAWPQLLATALCVLGYRLYVARIEKRAPAELAVRGAVRETGLGLGMGTLLSLAALGMLALLGSFQVIGQNSVSVLFKPMAELLLVAVFEELLFRAILLRMLQAALGTRWAMVLSSVLFAVAHVPNDGVSVLALGITLAAGFLFGAAYLATGRLWLTAGLHFAWNFVTGTVFALPVSGAAGKGWIVGTLSGPDWLSGGVYGIEASVVTLVLVLALTALLLRRKDLAGGG